MTSLTVAVDDEVAEGLKRLAQDREVALGDVVATALKEAVQREEARKRLRHLAKTAPIHLAPDWQWSREDIHDRPMLRGYQRPPLSGSGTAP